MCDADADGNVYTYTILTGDLLAGGGPELIGLQLASNGSLDGDPQKIVEKVCVAYLSEGGKVLVSAPDGLEDDPGFIVFVQDHTGAFHICNATGDAMIWSFEPIGDPLQIRDAGELAQPALSGGQEGAGLTPAPSLFPARSRA